MSVLEREDRFAHGPALPASALDRAFNPEQAAAIRIEMEDRSSLMVRRLELWRDEFVAWVKTLASAAVYATLIVTFGFQVARVEGQSMAPTRRRWRGWRCSLRSRACPAGARRH
jgi:hypothetical protein